MACHYLVAAANTKIHGEISSHVSHIQLLLYMCGTCRHVSCMSQLKFCGHVSCMSLLEFATCQYMSQLNDTERKAGKQSKTFYIPTGMHASVFFDRYSVKGPGVAA